VLSLLRAAALISFGMNLDQRSKGEHALSDGDTFSFTV
jgi:hypothetical protein